jgi:DNA-binding PadR family transcriptional regulator
MTPLTYQILVALADEPRHGYGIIKEIEERSGAGAAPSTGAMYLALQRMEQSGLIEDAPAEDDEGDARRRYYRLSRKGLEQAEDESRRLARLVSSAREKNLLVGESS